MTKMHLALLLALLALIPASEAETKPSPVYVDPFAPKEPLVPPSLAAPYLTTTVYGFLDFVTTIGNTVMVFTPQTAPPQGEKVQVSVIGGQEVRTVITSAAPKTALVSPSKSQQLESDTKASVAPTSKSKDDSKVLLKKSEPRFVVSVRTSSSSSEEEDKNGGHKASPILEGSEPIQAAASSPSSVTVIPSVIEASFLIDDDIQSTMSSASPTPPLLQVTIAVTDSSPSPELQVRTQVQTAVKVASSEASPTVAPKQQQKLPTGLVTTLDATHVADGVTTVVRTSVIGTFFDGKYAQILHSTAVILGGSSPQFTPLVSVYDNSFDGEEDVESDDAEASASEERTLYVLPEESATPTATVTRRHLSPPASRRPTSAFNSRRSSSRPTTTTTPPPTTPKAPPKSYQKSYSPRTSFRNRFTNPTPPTPPQRVSTVSVFASPSAPSRRSFQPSRTRAFTPSRRGFAPKDARSTSQSTTTPQAIQDVQPTPALRFKVPRNSGRWRYEPSPKPRVNIQKTDGTSPPSPPTTPSSPAPLATPQQLSPPEIQNKELPLQDSSSTSVSNEDEDDLQELIVGAEAETIRVTTTRAPLHDDDDDEVLLQVATIKSPYVFQAGAVKNTRFITLTHTQSVRLLQTVDPSLTENVLATTHPIDSILQGSHDVATLPPLTLIDNGDGVTQATPALDTVTQTLSTAELLLKTSVLPVVRMRTDGDENNRIPSTSYLTLTQSYLVTRLVTAVKTLPALEYYQFAPDRTLTEFNTLLQESGSEHREHVTDADDNPPNLKKVLPPPDLVSVGSPFDPSAMDNLQHIGNFHPTPAPPPTLPPTPPPPPPPPVHPYFNYFNPFAPYINPVPPTPPRQEQVVVTTSRPVIRTSTLYDTHVIAITPPSGGGPTYSTITRPAGTTTVTDYELDTVTQLANPQVPQGYPQPQYTLTSSPMLTSVTVTVTNSKILKLQFGARTTLTTIFSTSLVPTLTTVYVTTSAPVQPTAAYNPFFPAAGFPLPFVG